MERLLNPNTIAIIVSGIGSLVTWIVHKAHGDKVDRFDDAIRGLGKQVVHELLSDPEVNSALSSTALQAKAESLLRSLAATLKIPTSPITDALIKATAAHIVGDVQAALRELDDANDQLAQLTAQVAAFPAQLAKTEADAFAKGKAWAAENVEKVP